MAEQRRKTGRNDALRGFKKTAGDKSTTCRPLFQQPLKVVP